MNYLKDKNTTIWMISGLPGFEKHQDYLRQTSNLWTSGF